MGPRVVAMIGHFSKGLAETTGRKPDHASRYIAQRLSFSVHTSNTQMILARSDRWSSEDWEWLADRM